MKENTFHTSKGEITGKQVDEFILKMMRLFDEKATEELGVDDHNNPPVTVLLINDIKYQNHTPLLVEHRHIVETDYEKSERLFAIFLNVGEAFDRLECEMKVMRSKQLNIRDEEQKKQTKKSL